MAESLTEYKERIAPKMEWGVPRGGFREEKQTEPVDPHHPLVGAGPRKRLEYQIEMLELDILNAKQSGVRGENLTRWVEKLERKIAKKKELLEVTP